MLRIVHILKSLMMECLVDARGFGGRGSARVVRFALQLCLSLRDGVSGVVVRIGFVVRAIKTWLIFSISSLVRVEGWCCRGFIPT